MIKFEASEIKLSPIMVNLQKLEYLESAKPCLGIRQNQQNDCATSEDSDQPGHPFSLIRVFAVCMKKPWVLSYPLSAQRRLWSDWAHSHFVGFVMRQLLSRRHWSRKVFVYYIASPLLKGSAMYDLWDTFVFPNSILKCQADMQLVTII